MADAYRAKSSALSSAKAIHGAKGKSARPAASKNQQLPGTGQTSVLPRIDRRGEVLPKPQTPGSHASPRNGALSILLPPQRPSSKDASTTNGTSPTYYGDDSEGLSTKAAWGTPRAPASDITTSSHVASFFATPEEGSDRDECTVAMPTPLLLQSVEDSINANEERYRVDMEQLSTSNEKFFEISMSANQHLEHMHNQLPNIDEAFEQTGSALQSLSDDISALHKQHESVKQDMTSQFDAALNDNAEEMVALSAAYANERSELSKVHEVEIRDAEDIFREKVTELEAKYREMEKIYVDELQELRQTSALQLQTLQEKTRSEKEEQELWAKSTIEALQNKSKEELEDLQSRTQSAYKILEERSQARYTEIQRTSTGELVAVKSALTSEIMTLKENSAANLAALTDTSERELRELRQQHNEVLHNLQTEYSTEHAHLVENAAEEIARLRMFEIDQSTQIEARRCRETKSLRDALQATQTEYSNQIQGLHRRYTSQIEAMKATTVGEKSSLLKAHAAETEKMKETAVLQLSQTTSSYEDRLRFMIGAHETEITRYKEEAAQAIEALVAKYKSDIASLQNERVREKDALILHYEAEIDSLKRASTEEHENQVKLRESQIAQLREAHSTKVLALEMTMREQNKQAECTVREKDCELERMQARIDSMEASEIALKEYQLQFAERSRELMEQKNMAMCELDSEIWRLSQWNQEKDVMLESTNRELQAASEDLQVKASNILELTFVIKSRDEEIEKLRNALLDTVQTVNTKTEVLELTTETLSTKAKELEVTKNALRLESGRLSMVEESMQQKEGILENTELKMESMRLNMENMRLEMKRMQMDMKLQLEHTEGEIELKNGEIRRLHGAQSELKQKNDFCQQTIERLEESLAFTQRQGEEAQRRIDLLRLGATQAADEIKIVSDQLLTKEQDLAIMTRKKQIISSDKQRLQIEFNNLTHQAQMLREKVELYTMQAEEIQCRGLIQLQQTIAERDERIRSEKHLLMLELSSVKDMIRHLEGVEDQLHESTQKIGILNSEKKHLETETQTLNDTLKRYESTDRLLHEAEEDIVLKTKFIQDKVKEIEKLNKQLRTTEQDAHHRLDALCMEIEDSMSIAYELMCSKDEVVRLNKQLRSSLSNLRAEKEQLMLSLSQEKREVVVRAENLQEKLAGMRADGARTANELNDLQHALSEKKKELTYLQENLAEQTSDTRKVRSAFDALSNSHAELQERFTDLSNQRGKETQEHHDTIQSLEQNLKSKVAECETLQKSVEDQRQEHRQLLEDLTTNHDSHATHLIAGYHSQISQLTEDHRNQVAQLTEDHRTHLAQLTGDNRTRIAQLTEGHRAQLARLTGGHRTQLAQLMDERSKLAEEIARLKVEHLTQVVQLTGDRDSQVDQLTEDLGSQVSQLIEEHRNAVVQMEETRNREMEQLQEGHRCQVSRLEEDHLSQTSIMAEHHRNEVARLAEIRQKEFTQLKEDRDLEVIQLKENHNSEVSRLKDDHQSAVAQLNEKVTRLSGEYHDEVTQLSEQQRGEVARLDENHRNEIDQLTQAARSEVSQLQEDHRTEVARLIEDHHTEVARLSEDYGNKISGLTEDSRSEITRLNEEHVTQTAQLIEEYNCQINKLEADRHTEVARLEETHRCEIDQLIGAHRGYVIQLRAEHYDGFGLLQKEYEGKLLKETNVTFADKSNKERAASQTVEIENQQLPTQQQIIQSQALEQQQVLLQHAADERIRVVCARTLELMTSHVAHQHEIASMEQDATNSQQLYSKQIAALQVQISQMEAKHAQLINDLKKQHALDSNEQSQKAVTEHEKTIYELTAAFHQNMELMRLRLTEDHLVKINELLERARIDEERHTAALVVSCEDLGDKAKALKCAEGIATTLEADISELQSQLQHTKQEVAEREADVAAKNATIENVRKELNLLLDITKSTRSSEQFVALLRQQLETHLMEVYHIELNDLEGFVLEDENDLLECLKGFFAMRCYRGIGAPWPDIVSDSNGAVTTVDSVRSRLHEYDRVVAVVEQIFTSSGDNHARLSPSEIVSTLEGELHRLKLSVRRLFVCPSDNEEVIGTDVWVQLLSQLAGLFEVLAIPSDLEEALIRGRQLIDMLDDNQNVMSDAKASCLKDDIESMEDVRHLFQVIDEVLGRARNVTHSDQFVRLQDLIALFDEWEGLYREMDASEVASNNEEGTALDNTASRTGNHLRSTEILGFRQEAAAFVQRCKQALELTSDKTSLDDVVGAIQQLMKILHHFELLQPKLGSPHRQSTAEGTNFNNSNSAVTELIPKIENKVTAVLTFVEELQLMADFAQNILDDDSKPPGEPASNESSQSSLEALRALARTSSPASTLDELQIDVDLAIDDAIQDDDQNLCEFSTEEVDKPREDFFAASGGSPSRSPSPFLADSLMDISLVMNDHQRLLSQTARWIVKSRQSGTQGQKFSLGTEISHLVREHCAILSLSRHLFKMKDPRQELVSLLEGVALLERMTARLALFRTNSSRGTDEMSCQDSCFGDHPIGGSESGASLNKSDVDSTESSSRSMLASIGDMARHLQDYDYFLKQIKAGTGRFGLGNNSPASINIEELVHELNEQVTLVEQTKMLLGLEYPIDELPQFLIGTQEVLRQAKRLREESVCFEESVPSTDQQNIHSVAEQSTSDTTVGVFRGMEAVLTEMDAVVEDLRRYNDMLSWLKEVLPSPDSVKYVSDLKERLLDVLAQVERLTDDKSKLTQEKAKLESDLAQMERSRDGLVEQSSKEGELLMELTDLQSSALEASAEEASIRLEVLKRLIENQKYACNEVEQRIADERTETIFLRQHELLSEGTNSEYTAKEAALSVNTRIGIYSRLLECAESLRTEKSALEAEKSTMKASLNEAIQCGNTNLVCVKEELAQTRQEMANALAEERTFLKSKDALSSFLNIGNTEDGTFSRVPLYRQLYDEITRLLDEKQATERSDAQEYEFLQTHHLLSTLTDEGSSGEAVPPRTELSSIRMKVFQQLVHFLEQQLQQNDRLAEALSQESRFLQDGSLVFDVSEPHKSRLAVYDTLLAGQNALIEEKMERELTQESEKAFLVSHGVPAFDTAMEIYEQFVLTRQELAALAVEQEKEKRFLSDNQLCSPEDLAGDVASLTTPFSSSLRLLVYRKLLQNNDQAREEKRLLQESLEQQLSHQVSASDLVVNSLTGKVERLETALMWWHESAFASQQEWNRMLLEEEENRRSLIRYFEESEKHMKEAHTCELEKVTRARDSAQALAAVTHAEALEHAAKEHEARLAAELHKQAQQLKLAAFAEAEHESHKRASDNSTVNATLSLSTAQMRARLLEKFAKRDTAAISMIYKAIRLTTDILSSTSTSAGSTAGRSGSGNASEISADVTQAVLSCVKELKALKEYLVQSLEHVAKDDDQAPPPFAQAPVAKWMADAVARATSDKESAIDLALCLHREFMSFAQVQLLTRQDEAEKALTRLYDKLKTTAASGGFTAEQEKLLALEMEVTREKEDKENVACKFRLNEEYYRRLLDERKEMEIAQAATLVEIREESKALRLKLEKLELQVLQQHAAPQFRPPSGNVLASAPRSSVVSPRVLKSAAISTAPMLMRPERPRGGGSAHKERYVSDLEKETGQRRTSTASCRLNDWKAREDTIAEHTAEHTGTQLEQDFRALQAAATAYHTPALEPVVPTMVTAPATAPGSSLQNQELWYQGVRSIQYVSFFISVFHVPRQQLFRVEVFNSDTEQQQQTIYVTWTEMQAFLQESRKAVRLGIALPADSELAVTVPHHVRSEIMDVLFGRVRVYGEGTENILLGFE